MIFKKEKNYVFGDQLNITTVNIAIVLFQAVNADRHDALNLYYQDVNSAR